MVVFKMRDSLPSARYSPVCNVLRQWKTSLIPTYRVYRLYDSPVDLPKRVARGGSGGLDEPPTLQKRSAKFAYYICIVHVGDDDLARSGVYVRTR